MQWLKTKRVVHEVEPNSNLDKLCRNFLAVLSTGFESIATAISADYQRQIDELTAQLKSSTDKVEQAINNQPEGE
jgi:hypothetical protein